MRGRVVPARCLALLTVAAFAVGANGAESAGAGPADASPPAALNAGSTDPWPPGDDSDIARRACHDCHDPVVITASRLTVAQWSARVDAMLAKGARVTDDEIDTLIEYLATHFGPTP